MVFKRTQIVKKESIWRYGKGAREGIDYNGKHTQQQA